MIQNRTLLFGRVTALLYTIFLCSSAYTDDDQPNWYSSWHGDLLSCQSLTKRLDGSAILDRYLLLTPDMVISNSHNHNLGNEEQRLMVSGNAYALRKKLLDKSPRQQSLLAGAGSVYQELSDLRLESPDRIPFVVERYQLDSRGLIVNGELVQGTLDQNIYSWSGYLTGSGRLCHRVDEYLKTLPGEWERDFEPTGARVKSRTAISGSQPALLFEAGETIHLGGEALPLFMLATNTSPSGYEQIYDTLYMAEGGLDFSADQYWYYQNSNKYLVGMGVAGGLSTLGGVSLFSAAAYLSSVSLAVLGTPVTVLGLAAAAALYSELKQNPSTRSLNRMMSLDDEKAGLTVQLEAARVKKVNSQMSLAQLKVYGNDDMLRDRQKEFSELKARHDSHMDNARWIRSNMEKRRRDLESELRQLVEMGTLRDEYLQQEIAETTHRIAELKKKIRKLPTANLNSPLPYPEVDKMPSPYSHQDFTQDMQARTFNLELEDLEKYYQHLGNRKMNASIDARLYLGSFQTLFQDRIQSLDRDIEYERRIIREQQLQFDQTHGETNRYIDKYFDASHEISHCETSLKLNLSEQKVVLKEAWLMDLLFSYQQSEQLIRFSGTRASLK